MNGQAQTILDIVYYISRKKLFSKETACGGVFSFSGIFGSLIQPNAPFSCKDLEVCGLNIDSLQSIKKTKILSRKCFGKNAKASYSII